MPRRRIQERIEGSVAKAIATDDPIELDLVIQELRRALHEHSERLRKTGRRQIPPYRIKIPLWRSLPIEHPAPSAYLLSFHTYRKSLSLAVATLRALL